MLASVHLFHIKWILTYYDKEFRIYMFISIAITLEDTTIKVWIVLLFKNKIHLVLFIYFYSISYHDLSYVATKKHSI